MRSTHRLHDASPPVTFDVVCAGETVWRADRLHTGAGLPIMRARLLDVARLLAGNGLSVGLATVLDEDRFGRALLAEVGASGIDTSGVRLAAPASGVVVVDAGGAQLRVLADAGTARDFEIPARWSSAVLLLSGLSPVTSRAAAMCRAARRARRAGSIVVLDASSGSRQWIDHEPRVLSMLLREVDVVRVTLMSLAVLGLDTQSLRRAMRREATLILGDGARATATGPFGDVSVLADAGAVNVSAEASLAAICGELARPRAGRESAASRWNRVLREPSASLQTR